MLNIREADQTRWDLVSLGEVMLRLDPGDVRIWTTREFQAWEGGGEYNVARGLKRCFGLRTARGDRVRRQPGRPAHPGPDLPGRRRSVARPVGASSTASGRTVRNGLNFTERGFGVRAAVGCSDRGHTAASQLKPGDVDWDEIFGERGRALVAHRRHLLRAVGDHAAGGHGSHAGGQEARHDRLLRPQLPRLALEGHRRQAARRARSTASWRRYVDVMIGNEEDFTAALGFEVEGVDQHLSKLDPANFFKMIERAVKEYPNFKVVATTLRNAQTASRQRLGRGLLARRAILPGGPAQRTWRSSTASAAATRSPPA